MKFLGKLLSEETLGELKTKLGDDLVKQINEKVGDFSINIGKEKLIPKSVYDEDKASLKKQLDERDVQLTELQKSNKDNSKLSEEIEELKKTNKLNKENYDRELTATRQKYAFESAISGAKAKNPKALAALIDMSKVSYEDDGNGGYKVKGIDEQVESLKKSDAYLFDGHVPGSPNPQNPEKPEPNPSGDSALRDCFGLSTENK